MTPSAAPELTRQVNDKQVSGVWILSLSAGIAAAGPAMRSRHIQLVVIGALFEGDQCIRRRKVCDNFTSEAAGRDVERRWENHL